MGDVEQLMERLDALAERRDREGIYTDGNIAYEASYMLGSFVVRQKQDEHMIEHWRHCYLVANDRLNAANAKLEKVTKVLELMAEPMAHDCQTIARSSLEEIGHD